MPFQPKLGVNSLSVTELPQQSHKRMHQRRTHNIFAVPRNFSGHWTRGCQNCLQIHDCQGMKYGLLKLFSHSAYLHATAL